jgi:DNA-binding NtrC family response regulator
MNSQQTKLEEQLKLARAAGIHGRDETLIAAIQKALKVAPAGTNVLILGARGTGKELFARLIHQNSARSDNQFEALNCAAIPETLFASQMFGHIKGAFTDAHKNAKGHFELADKGTLFLDELGEMPLTQQTGLLRVMQEGKCRPVGADKDIEVRPRIIAATNVDLAEAVGEGRLREDLLDRFGYRLTLPSLAQRRSDIQALAEAFLQDFVKAFRVAGRPCPRKLASCALGRLERHTWPGNIRELRSTIESACVEAETLEIREENLTIHPPVSTRRGDPMPEPVPGFDLQKHLERVRDHCYRRAIELAGGNMSKAADLLKTSKQAVKQWQDKQDCRGVNQTSRPEPTNENEES